MPDVRPVTVTDELYAPVSNGVELCYQTFGDPDDEPLLLIMGLGGPMTWWDPELCTRLARLGFYVIRYDNRDTGRSSRVGPRVSRTALVRAFAGTKVRAPYSMGDLASDGFGLLDHLGCERAHVVGVSMGGMIAQTMALARPDRVMSLTSIMSTTGRRSVGWQDPRLLPMLIGRRGGGREVYVAGSVKTWQMIGSPEFPEDPDRTRERAEVTYDRGFTAAGVMRQMLAVLTQPNRSRDLHSLRVPTLVIHGLRDRMVHVSGGRSTSSAIRGSELLLIEGMGHDLPVPLHPTFAEAIRRNADRASTT